MSEAQTDSSKFDPLDPFRVMRDAYLDAMAKAMVEAVNTEAYAQASGAVLENSLAMSAPFREATEKSMLQVLGQLSLPSRQDIIALAERFTNLEMRLDEMDAKLDRIEAQTHAVEHLTKTATAKPAQATSGKPNLRKVATRTPVKRSKAVKQAQPPKQTARKRRGAR